MKSEKFAVIVGSIVRLLEGVGRPDAAAAWHELSRAFSAKPDVDVNHVCGHIGRAMSASSGGEVELVLSTLPAINKFMNNKALEKDMRTLEGALASHHQSNLVAIIDTAIASLLAPPPAKNARPAASAEALADYEQRLQSALGTEPLFHAVLAEVKKDQAITPAQASALALAIAGIPVKTKPKAWEAISARHATLVGGRARAKAEGNRTAA